MLLADQHALFRAAIAAALQSQDEFEVVGEAGDGDSAVSEVRRLNPDVAVLDAGLSVRDGVAACAAIKGAGLTTRVLVASDTADQQVLLAAVQAGADGYTTKQARLADLVGAVRLVSRGDACVPSNMLGALLHDLIERRREEDAALERFSQLSRREREVISLLVQGHDHDAIGKLLVISPETSRTHIQNSLSKLGVHSRLEATALVMQHNLLERFPAGRG